MDDYLFEMPERILEEKDSAQGNKHKPQGDMAELLFDYQACQNGMFSSRPCTEALPYDRVLDNGLRLFKVQIKSVNLKKKSGKRHLPPSYQYNIKGSYKKNRSSGPCHKSFDAREFDLLAVFFVGYSDQMLFFLPSYFHGRSQCWMNPNGTTMDRLVSWDYLKSLSMDELHIAPSGKVLPST
tara:strand:+ start:3185 stop:3730 length:546 start_codon:yes stop_codon:yes gene_type:complete